MGILFSRFRKKKTTIEVLDDLDKKIKDIEQYGQNTEQRHKKIIGFLFIYSGILYIVTAMIFYFYFFPAKLYDQLFYITPLLIFPILILFTKKTVSWYYRRKISRNQEKLETMQQQKKKILEEVTETETYKKAKEILLKFAPDQLRMTPLSPQNTKQSTPAPTTPKMNTPQVYPSAQAGSELRRRALTSSTLNQNQPNKIVPSVPVGVAPTQSPLPLNLYPTNNSINSVTPVPKTPLPRPILPQQRSYIDRLVEYVVGDGPNNRYALVCRQCDSHNGMALKEEFEYFAFRCCYCNFWNPARKQKPSAPKLEFSSGTVTPQRLSLQTKSVSIENLSAANAPNSESTTNLSDTDSDIEVVEKPSTTPDSDENNVAEDTDKLPILDEESKSSEKEDITEAEKENENKTETEPEAEKMEVDESPKE